jgi:hypothetical protein
MKTLYWLFFLFSLIPLYSEEILQLNNVIIHRNPESISRSVPSGLIPESSTILHTTELRSFGIENSEISVVLTNPLTVEQLVFYYEMFLKSMEWKILQKENKEIKYILLAENQIKRVVTLIIYPNKEKDGSIVKIFLRRNYNF